MRLVPYYRVLTVQFVEMRRWKNEYDIHVDDDELRASETGI